MVVVLQRSVVVLSLGTSTQCTYVVTPSVTVDVSGITIVVCSVLVLVWISVV